MTETGGSGSGGPLGLLREAIRYTPAASWAMGVVGLAAAAAIIGGVTGSPVAAFIGVAAIFPGMIALFVFSRLIVLAKYRTGPVAVVLLWFGTITAMAAIGFLFTSVFIDVPWRLRTAAERAVGLPPRATAAARGIRITSIPQSIPCRGPSVMGPIAGRVEGLAAPQTYRVVVYVLCEGKWYVQPLADEPQTRIEEDGSWSNTTHTGMSYAAIVVKPSYAPPGEIDALPQGSGDVLAMARLDLAPLTKE